LAQKIVELTGKIPWPSIYEEEQAVLDLLRIQYVYDVDLKEVIILQGYISTA
jgi:hypothetical protein